MSKHDGKNTEVELFGQTMVVQDAPEIKGEAVVVVRPEALSLSQEEGIAIEVESAVYLGSAMEYRVVLPNGERVIALHSNPNLHKQFGPGQSAFLQLDSHAVHLLPATS